MASGWLILASKMYFLLISALESSLDAPNISYRVRVSFLTISASILLAFDASTLVVFEVEVSVNGSDLVNVVVAELLTLVSFFAKWSLVMFDAGDFAEAFTTTFAACEEFDFVSTGEAVFNTAFLPISDTFAFWVSYFLSCVLSSKSITKSIKVWFRDDA